MVLPKEFERLMMCCFYILGIELAVLGREVTRLISSLDLSGGETVN